MISRRLVFPPLWAAAFALGLFLAWPQITAYVLSAVGYHHFFSSNYQQAHTWFENAVQVERTVQPAWRGLAKSAASQGQIKAAIEALDQALSFQSNNIFTRIELADLHWQQGNYQAVYAGWQEIGSSEALIFLGNRAVAIGDIESAMALFEIAAEKEPQNWKGNYLFGTVLLKKARYGEAEKALRASLQYAPDSPPILLNLGKAQVGDDRCEDAIASFTRVTELQPLNWIGWYWSGLCWERLNMQEKALNAFMIAEELNPTDPNVANAVDRLQNRPGEN